MPAGRRPRVVIVGAGFGGLWATRALARSSVDVLLVDRNNYHTFLPLLYQVAAAELEPEAIVFPVRSILRKFPNVDFMMAEVSGIDLSARVVRTQQAAVPYDYLILAAGSTPHFFGIEGAAEYSLPLKSLEEGIRLRNHILQCFERGIGYSTVGDRRRTLTFAVVGGGPTGVEFTGALAELIRRPLRRDYPKLDFREAHLVVLEAADRLLPALPARLGDYALARLRRMGVEVRLQAMVSKITSQAVHLKDGLVIPAESVIWTAGVRGDPRVESWGLPTDRGGRVVALSTLQLPSYPEVFIIGDLVRIEAQGHPLPMLAPVAIQQGKAAAENIRLQIAGQAAQPFRFRDPGTMATIGRNSAVAELHGRTFTGFAAWLLWLGVHVYQLIGFRNRLIVLINWAWDYFLYERAVRLILPRER